MGGFYVSLSSEFVRSLLEYDAIIKVVDEYRKCCEWVK
ncbi:hypothetical protein PC129_g6505 [Phytophthora cactorum]|uniref:Uncharacterized protein n=1 Tax=Phytophthora cactorum TaxID=29920 RepID=A0A8T1CLQ6_9STRA|nr:hypothetical protein PC112_g8386 [Phytophthora cactorum]KAG2927142.1 hypothetical protein PC115_g7683 [Phytophthora cactorum]KAG2998632.1 hypothetical protein PC118_g1228 [Phytophthora cactorum]KAG3175254.1 hypothetical protein C6341_g9520 [Phytophthora cactorum]KAG3222773.1 hypothetical protein PC129_g6505 [Phytophthora cactorum]